MQAGNIVMIAVQVGFEAADHGELLNALETAMFGSVSGMLELRNINNEAFAMIFKKGEHVNYIELSDAGYCFYRLCTNGLTHLA